MGRKELRCPEAPLGRESESSLWSHSDTEDTVSFVGEGRGHDQSNGLDRLSIQFIYILIFFDAVFLTGSTMQNQTQRLTPGSMNSVKVPVSCSTSFRVSAKAHPDTEILRISLSIILMKRFCSPFWAHKATFFFGSEAFGKHLEGWGPGVARQLGLLEPTRVARWLCGSENSTD